MAKRRRPSGGPNKPNASASGAATPPAEQGPPRPTESSPSSPSAASPLNPRDQLRRDMLRSIITEPLLSKVQADPDGQFDVIIVLNELFEGGIQAALVQVQTRAKEWGVVTWSSISNYCFARLSGPQILRLASEARDLTAKSGSSGSVVYRIWEDNEIDVTLTKTLTTVKADAAQRAFHAHGEDIVWAVLDSGIDGSHPHFRCDESPFGPIHTLDCPRPVQHLDFTPDGGAADAPPNSALQDRFGHGSHVAGIIAGYWESKATGGDEVVGTEVRDESTDQPVPTLRKLTRISGVAPCCTLVSLKVIADVTRTDANKQRAGQGKVSWVLKAIDKIQEWNQNGKRIQVHGVNMSLGYDFDARWFGCGQSPICTEVDRLVRSGVCVVVSAGNSGYPTAITASGKVESRYNAISITDPGNADLAITVGSTHRDMPHRYGVSYFSSRGPTGDGRRKPDLLAPGERIWSCAAGDEAKKYAGVQGAEPTQPVLYCEQTGTSMAAPHVSGAVAAFLSVRQEFIGQPERVKAILLQNAVDLGRETHFQGAGLLDLMKVLQAV
jgi:serine protease AprX